MEYGTGAIMAVPAHDERDYEFCSSYGLPIRTVIVPEGTPAGSRSQRASPRDGGLRTLGGFRPLYRTHVGRGHRAYDPRRRGEGIRQRDGSISHQGLGNFAPTLLGHTHPHDLLRGVRNRAGAGKRLARGAAAERQADRAGALTAGGRAGICEYDLPQVRQTGAARDRYHGHVRGFLLVLLPLHRSQNRDGADQQRSGEVLVPG